MMIYPHTRIGNAHSTGLTRPERVAPARAVATIATQAPGVKSTAGRTAMRRSGRGHDGDGAEDPSTPGVPPFSLALAQPIAHERA
jgi:hypothetical protein